MGYAMDFWHAIITTLTAMDKVSLGIFAIVIVAAGLMMEGLERIISTTVIALVLFGLASYVRLLAMDGGKMPGTIAGNEWHGLMAQSMQTFLIYAVIAAIGIAIIQIVRQIAASR